MPRDLVTFSPLRARPNTVWNRRLPEITPRAVLPIVPLGGSSSLQDADDLTRAETFPGAACLTRFVVRQAPIQISRDLLGTTQSGSPPGLVDAHTPTRRVAVSPFRSYLIIPRPVVSINVTSSRSSGDCGRLRPISVIACLVFSFAR